MLISTLLSFYHASVTILSVSMYLRLPSLSVFLLLDNILISLLNIVMKSTTFQHVYYFCFSLSVLKRIFFRQLSFFEWFEIFHYTFSLVDIINMSFFSNGWFRMQKYFQENLQKYLRLNVAKMEWIALGYIFHILWICIWVSLCPYYINLIESYLSHRWMSGLSISIGLHLGNALTFQLFWSTLLKKTKQLKEG